MTILSTYHDASPQDISAGTYWYLNAHSFALGLASDHNIPTPTAAAIIAVLSPRLHWTKNQLAASELISTGNTSLTLRENREKARAVLLDGPAAFYRSPRYGDLRPALAGLKVRSFYSNILHPTTSPSVTIDRHAIAIYDPNADPRILDSPAGYNFIADQYRAAARTLNMRPSTLQAITWVAHRRLKLAPQKETLF